MLQIFFGLILTGALDNFFAAITICRVWKIHLNLLFSLIILLVLHSYEIAQISILSWFSGAILIGDGQLLRIAAFYRHLRDPAQLDREGSGSLSELQQDVDAGGDDEAAAAVRPERDGHDHQRRVGCTTSWQRGAIADKKGHCDGSIFE